jgi:hypothetical protein
MATSAGRVLHRLEGIGATAPSTAAGAVRPDLHPSFVEVPGPVATWERNVDAGSPAS